MPMWRSGLADGSRIRSGPGLAIICAGYLLLGSVCLAAGDAPAGAPVPDHATEALLHTVVQQIVGGRIISPPEDNAMQTWQRVLQRDIATQRSPEVFKALEDFDTYARARAASERTAGRALVAAELTVFADQASRMTGRIPPGEATGGAASAPDAVSSNTPSTRPAGGTAAPVQAASGAAASAQSATPATAPATVSNSATSAGPLPSTATAAAPRPASSGTAAADAAVPEVPQSRPTDLAGSATETAANTVPPARPVPVTEAVAPVVPPTQAPGATAVAAGTAAASDGRPSQPVGNAQPAAGGAESAVVKAVADSATVTPSTGAVSRTASSGIASPPAVMASGEAAQAVAPRPAAQNLPAGQSGAVPSVSPVPPQVVTTIEPPQTPPAGNAAPATPGTAHQAVAAPLVVASNVPPQAAPVDRATPATATAAAQPAPAADTGLPPAIATASTPPAASESELAVFYAARGDAMLASKDISAARKFYEFAANAGSARAATALARTYDPAFAAQLVQIGMRPDPVLAAVWYRKAAELGGVAARLSQSGDTGK